MGRKSSRGKRFHVESTVRSVRCEVSRWDPAGFRPKGERGKFPAQYLDEYVTPSLRVAQAILDGATSADAINVFRREMTRLFPDRELSPDAMRKLARHWSWYNLRWWQRLYEAWRDRGLAKLEKR